MDNNAIRNYPWLKSALNNVKQAPSKELALLYINTSMSASFAEFSTFPLDLLKTRLHIQGEAAERAHLYGKRHGMFGTIQAIAGQEGMRGFYGGLSAKILRTFLFNGPRFVIYHYLRHQFMHVDDHGKKVPSILRDILAASMAGSVAQFVANPLDIVKVRMQVEGMRRAQGFPERGRSVWQSLKYIYTQGGLNSLWKGVGPCCLRAKILTAGDTVGYNLSKSLYIYLLGLEDGRIIQFLASISSALTANLLCSPSDVIKSRIMNQPYTKEGRGLHYKHTLDCLYKLVKNEGFSALFKGIVPCWLRVCPYKIFFWLAFEELQRLQGQNGF